MVEFKENYNGFDIYIAQHTDKRALLWSVTSKNSFRIDGCEEYKTRIKETVVVHTGLFSSFREDEVTIQTEYLENETFVSLLKNLHLYIDLMKQMVDAEISREVAKQMIAMRQLNNSWQIFSTKENEK